MADPRRDGREQRRVGGRVVWIGLALSYHLWLRASELFADDKGWFHEVYCLRRGEIAHVKGDEQLEGKDIRAADKVDVRVRRSKGDQGRKGAVLVRKWREGSGRMTAEGWVGGVGGKV